MSPRLLLGCLFLITGPLGAYQFAFPPEPQPTVLTPQQQNDLAQTGLAKGLQQEDNKGEAWLVLDLPVEPRRLWPVILDFERYPDRVDSMRSAQVVKQSASEDRRLIWTDYELARFWVSLKYRLVHEYWPAKSYMRWTLDSDYANELNRVEGYWNLRPHPVKPGWSRVFYGARLTAFDWLPDWIQELLAQEGLDTTGRWLKEAAEELGILEGVLENER